MMWRGRHALLRDCLQTCLVLSVLRLPRPKHCGTCCRERVVVSSGCFIFFLIIFL